MLATITILLSFIKKRGSFGLYGIKTALQLHPYHSIYPGYRSTVWGRKEVSLFPVLTRVFSKRVTLKNSRVV